MNLQVVLHRAKEEKQACEEALAACKMTEIKKKADLKARIAKLDQRIELVELVHVAQSSGISDRVD